MEEQPQLVRYLLGLLPEEDAERLDEASIVDDWVAARLRETEDDLIDAYVRGTLDAATRDRFEAVYLASPRRRERVDFARRFLAAVDRVAPPASVAPAPVRIDAGVAPTTPPRITDRLARAKFSWPVLAIAASLLFACGVLLFDAAQLREQLDQARSRSAVHERQTQALTQQLDEARTANAQTLKALDEARAASPARDPRSTSGAVPPASAPPLLAMVLSPDTRSIGALPTVAVSPATDRIPFELRLESNDFPKYRALLRDPRTNRVVWRSAILDPSPLGGTFSVSIVMPTAELVAQRYSFELAGLDATGRQETIANYAFQLNRR